MTPNLRLAALAEMAVPPAGMPATTLAKMMMDIPLPMPRWVISSPSHMTKAVPGGEASGTMKPARQQGEVGDQVDVLGRAGRLAAVVEDVDEPRRLQQGQADREVAGRLGDLLLARPRPGRATPRAWGSPSTAAG